MLRCIMLAGAVLLGLSGPAMAETFAEPHWGIAFDVPDGWRRESPGSFVEILRPPAGEASEALAVSVQNTARPADVPAGEGAKAAAARYVAEVKAATRDTRILREADFRWDSDAYLVVGRQVVADFVREGVALRQWAVFLPSPFGAVVHVWIYTAPQASFDAWLTRARRSLDSLVPRQPETPPSR